MAIKADPKPAGPPTGLCDINGKHIHVGDLVKLNTVFNPEVHGDYSIYRIEMRGMVPVMIYQRSQKGQALPKGYNGTLLSSYYDLKMLLFATHLSDVRPKDRNIQLYEGE
ncbi:hypothetical protein Enr10x_21330 [Gimesia panareensis]|uniref:Uncharacterized protein n=1 Tax=Gimesia panareensis TaxID=2527978 RepID=A0A517Q5A9_9PLAN|nr:hypothetical protein [Gimesia panareensis]QDT26823.1 hypothetical protein Enr10x_21330 [Gimesia panareensis]